MTDLETRSLVGKSLVVVTIANILINIGVIVTQILSLAMRKMKLKLLQFKQSKRIKEQKVKQRQNLRSGDPRFFSHITKVSLHQNLRQNQESQVQSMQGQSDFVKNESRPVVESQLIFGNPFTPLPPATFPEQSLRTNKQKSAPNAIQVTNKPQSRNQVSEDEESKISTKVPQTRAQKQIKDQRSLVKLKVKEPSNFRLAPHTNSRVKPSQVYQSNRESSKHTAHKHLKNEVCTIATFTSQIYQRKIEVRETRIYDELARISVTQDNIEKQFVNISSKDDSFSVNKKRQRMMQVAQDMEIDIPQSVQSAISDGSFENYLEAYRQARFLHRRDKPAGKVFLDIGDYNLDLPLKDKIEMYQLLKEYQREVQKRQQKK